MEKIFSITYPDKRNNSVMESDIVGLMVWWIMQTNRSVSHLRKKGKILINLLLFKWFMMSRKSLCSVHTTRHSTFHLMKKKTMTKPKTIIFAGYWFNANKCNFCLSREHPYDKRRVLLSDNLWKVLPKGGSTLLFFLCFLST